MKLARIREGRVLQRRSFRALSPLAFLGFCGGAAFVVFSGFREGDPVLVRMAGVCLVVGALCVRITRSRIHLQDGAVVVVNPISWHDIPCRLIYRAEGVSGGSLVIRTKDATYDDEGCLSVGFAGSLLDRFFKTTEGAVREINRWKKNARTDSVREIYRGFSIEPLADLQVLLAIFLMPTSLLI